MIELCYSAGQETLFPKVEYIIILLSFFTFFNGQSTRKSLLIPKISLHSEQITGLQKKN